MMTTPQMMAVSRGGRKLHLRAFTSGYFFRAAGCTVCRRDTSRGHYDYFITLIAPHDFPHAHSCYALAVLLPSSHLAFLIISPRDYC